MHHSLFSQNGASTCALFIGSYRLRNVNVRFTDAFEGRRSILLQSDEYGVMESLVIPFSHILKVINSHHVKDFEKQSHGICVELDTTASKKLALIYAEALNEEQRKIIFYDLTRFDEPKMTITMLFTSDYTECSCYRRLDRWVRRGNVECVTRHSRNGLVILEELPYAIWSTYLAGLGVVQTGNSMGCSKIHVDSDGNRPQNIENSTMTCADNIIPKELPSSRNSRSNHLYKDVFDSDDIEKIDMTSCEKATITSDVDALKEMQEFNKEAIEIEPTN